MSYQDQDNFFAQAYRTGTDRWTHIPFTQKAQDLSRYLSKGAMVLDVGTGRGKLLEALSMFGFKAIGLEKNSALVVNGNTELKAKGKEKEVRFMEGDVLDIPFADESFDGVTDIGLLHHLKPEDFETYVSEMARVLKSGGYAFIATLSKNTPNYFDWAPSLAEASDFERDGVKYHFFSDEELTELFQDNFEMVETSFDAPHGAKDAVYAVLILKKK